MKHRLLLLLNTLLLLILLCLNIWIFIHRNDGYAYKELASYNQLYYHQGMDLIKGIQLKKDSIQVLISSPQQNGKWHITYNGHSYPYQATHPVIPLIEGKTNYLFHFEDNANANPIELSLYYTPSNTYRKAGRSLSSVLEICHANVPIGEINLLKPERWEQQSPYTVNHDLNKIDEILQQEIQIRGTDHSLDKIEKIAAYLLKNLSNSKGIPTDTMDGLSPLAQFQVAKDGRSQIWCGNFTDIFSTFANQAGVLTRLVATVGEVDQVIKSRHSVNECFVPELNKWVMVDLTEGLIFAKKDQEQYLNAIELYRLHHLGSRDIFVVTLANDSIIELPYKVMYDFYDFYFNPFTEFAYYLNSQFHTDLYAFLPKMKRYLSKAPTYLSYSESTQPDNKKFYFKIFSFYALVVYFIFWIISLLAFAIGNKLKK